MLNDNRVRIIIGHYGSGKTEFAVNYIQKLAKLVKRPAIADLDIVNVYFRSREKADMLAAQGIDVISSNTGHGANLDLPAISARVLAPLQDDSYDVVLDVGGDSTGSRVLVRYQDLLKHIGYDMFCVVNVFRQETQSREGVIKHILDIEEASGLKITGLINNSHLLRETSVDDVMKGQKMIESVSAEMKIPIKYISTLEEVAEQLPSNLSGEIFPIKLYMRPDWM